MDQPKSAELVPGTDPETVRFPKTVPSVQRLSSELQVCQRSDLARPADGRVAWCQAGLRESHYINYKYIYT